MSGVKGKDTQPELLVRRALHARGFRYRLHAKDIPGKPDMVFPQFRSVVFVHGCFWHGHDCPLFRMPSTREDFWRKKIMRNRQRDNEVSAMLRESGWRQLIVWECALKGRGKLPLEAVINQIAGWIRGFGDRLEIKGIR